MYVYLSMIAIIVCLPFFFELLTPQKRKENSLKAAIFLLFLLFALKAPSVGRDIEGYKTVYNYMINASWSDFDVCWMEWGYEFLMMIFVHIFRADFHVFMVVIYGFVFWTYYNFIRKYSMDYVTSVLIYICFTFSTFDMSGVRNTIAIALCLLAFDYGTKKGVKNVLKFIAIVVIAAQIHTSAYIFLPAIIIIKLPVNRKSLLLCFMGTAIVFVLRKPFILFIKYNIKDIIETNLTIGGNTIMYILFIALSIVIIKLVDDKNRMYVRKMERINIAGKEIKYISGYTDIVEPLKMCCVGVVLLLFASTSGLTRLAQFYQFFLIILLPNTIMKIDGRTRFIIKAVLYVFLVVYYWKYALSVNSLDILPYKVFFA